MIVVNEKKTYWKKLQAIFIMRVLNTPTLRGYIFDNSGISATNILL